jgi:hypothetical protein
MARPVAHAGVRLTIAFAVCANGDSPGLAFYDGLSKKDQARVMVLFQKLGDTGALRVVNITRRSRGIFGSSSGTRSGCHASMHPAGSW